MMSVIPYDNGTFLVSSRSRPGMQHLVDLCYQESPKDPKSIVCGCEQNFLKGKPCIHMLAVLKYVTRVHK